MGFRFEKYKDGIEGCARPGCTGTGKPRYCSRRCAAITNAQQSGVERFRQMGRRGIQAKRRKGRASPLTASDRLLMAAGRYDEAARHLYDRGYSSGWNAHDRGRRQLPWQRTA